MSQHFLLTAKARTLSLKKIYKMGEAAAYDLFRQ
ncbi:MAG: IS1595 family transposase, partial [Robiginitomaculum sp.]